MVSKISEVNGTNIYRRGTKIDSREGHGVGRRNASTLDQCGAGIAESEGEHMEIRALMTRLENQSRQYSVNDPFSSYALAHDWRRWNFIALNPCNTSLL